ncbi:MAG: hypothetical protein JNJ77_07575 [Planctomycetia bacterium]|nr:hypothetical protein [Planctomycetia bacterium]
MIAKTWNVSFETHRKGQRVMTTRMPSPVIPEGRIPRISRLIALAHHLERLVVTGVVKDYAELARLGHVSRARISQIMNLLLLAPDIQEAILFLPKTTLGHDPIKLKHLQSICLVKEWEKQRERWLALSDDHELFSTQTTPYFTSCSIDSKSNDDPLRSIITQAFHPLQRDFENVQSERSHSIQGMSGTLVSAEHQDAH